MSFPAFKSIDLGDSIYELVIEEGVELKFPIFSFVCATFMQRLCEGPFSRDSSASRFASRRKQRISL